MSNHPDYPTRDAPYTTPTTLDAADAVPESDEVKRLRAEVKRLTGLAYIPGGWHCAKCQLSLISTRMHVHTGTFSADNKPHDCPNGCGPMWRETERDAGNRVCDRLVELQKEAASWKAVAHDHSERLKVIAAESHRMRETLRQIASECAECHGEGAVISHGGMGTERDECGACADVRAAIGEPS